MQVQLPKDLQVQEVSREVAVEAIVHVNAVSTDHYSNTSPTFLFKLSWTSNSFCREDHVVLFNRSILSQSTQRSVLSLFKKFVVLSIPLTLILSYTA
jgi:hypothetical protein